MLKTWSWKRQKQTRALTRTRTRRPSPLLRPVEQLEERMLLSEFYELNTIASTADGAFTGFGDLVSVNSGGDIAFVGSTVTGNGLYVVKPAVSLAAVNINPNFSNDLNRDFGREADAIVAVIEDSVII